MTTMPLATSLGRLERELMTLLWDDGPQTGPEIVTVLNTRRRVAYTTVSTTLERLWRRGLLGREREAGRSVPVWRYTPRLTRQELFVAAIAQLARELETDEVERQYAAIELRRGRLAV